jgi:hypothetical protein
MTTNARPNQPQRVGVGWLATASIRAETALLLLGGCRPLCLWCGCKRRSSSAVAVSGDRPMKAAKARTWRMSSRRVSSLKPRTVTSSINPPKCTDRDPLSLPRERVRSSAPPCPCLMPSGRFLLRSGLPTVMGVSRAGKLLNSSPLQGSRRAPSPSDEPRADRSEGKPCREQMNYGSPI